jgi:DNA-binding PadR family transcriptional regulator
MERKLLLLGMLRMQEMHGYQINEFIDTHLGSSGVYLKKATAYHLLNTMTDDGWVTYKEEQEGNRPPRRVYAITAEGEAAFQKLLRECLVDYKPAEFRSDIALAFLDMLPANEALSLLQKRRAAIEDLLEPIHTFGEHHGGGLQLMLEHQVRHLTAELEWLDEVIARQKTS